MASNYIFLTKDETSVSFSNLVWKGNWSSGAYDANDAVAHLGKMWWATGAITTEVPGTDAEWQEIPAGPAGADGADGAAGADGVFAGTEDTVTPTEDDLVPIYDESDANNPKKALISAILALVSAGSGISIVSAPVNASGTGSVGQFAYDGFYIYMCVATNTWRRWAHNASW